VVVRGLVPNRSRLGTGLGVRNGRHAQIKNQ
jgi:hypothetical protein